MQLAADWDSGELQVLSTRSKDPREPLEGPREPNYYLKYQDGSSLQFSHLPQRRDLREDTRHAMTSLL